MRNKFLDYYKHIERHHHGEELIRKAFDKKMKELYQENDEFKKYFRHVRYSRPAIIVFNIIVWFLIFNFFGIRVMSITFAVIISIAGFLELIFLLSLEKRVLKPIKELIEGVDEISKGNYQVQVEYNGRNEVSVLAEAFNDMAKKLHEGEILKAEYESNRKALVANISHDLKTPITSIQGYVEVIMKTENMPQDTLNKYHHTIFNNAVYVNKLIDDLFLFSKLDMDKLEFEFEKLNLKAFMDDVMQEFEFELDSKNATLYYERNINENYYFNIDRKRMYQVLRNIIGNAVKYGDKENLQLRVKLYVEENYAYIKIADNGPGIPADKLPHIFDRFYRVEYARTKDLMSTGLGLAISKELVEAQNGKITVTSEENKGTCFTIRMKVERGN